ncbi:DNA repair protein RadA [Rhodococcus aerolatus]
MARPRSTFRCTHCQHVVGKWVGRCPECGEWGSVAEVAGLAAVGGGAQPVAVPTRAAQRLTAVDVTAAQARPTGVGELDRVLGGGLVDGSVVLLAGEPGVGKSTLLLEVVRSWAVGPPDGRSGTALYVTGEESAAQVRLRAERTGAVHESVWLAAENDLATLLGHVDAVGPDLLVVDSVQTMHAAGTDGASGGVAQVKAVTAALTSLARARGLPVVLVGHVTKDGAIAGPRSLEHMVDVVLHFEGERHSTVRMVRGVKNRYGAADEVGCFELHDSGIAEVTDPSGLFLARRTEPVPGTAVSVRMEGTRPLLGEVQALVAGTGMSSPRRAVSGLDSARVAMVLAVLERRAGLVLHDAEVYAATVGGMRTTEPAADLAVALAVASAKLSRAVPAGLVVVGEVGLAGEIRRVAGTGRRLAEARRQGYTHALVPPGSDAPPDGMRVRETSDVAAALAVLTR